MKTRSSIAFAGVCAAMVVACVAALKCNKPEPVPPTPPTPPTPPAAVATLWLVEETADRTEALTAILADEAVRGHLEASGVKLREIDDDVTDASGKRPAELEPIFAAVGTSPLPQFVVQDKTGKVLGAFAAPATAAELVAKLKGVGQ